MKKIISFKSIKYKVLFAFSLVISLVIILGVYNMITMKQMNNQVEDIVKDDLQTLIGNQGMETTLSKRVAAARGYIFLGDSELKDRFASYTERAIEFENLARSAGVNEEFDDLMDRTVAWRTAVNEDVFDVYDRGDEELAIKNLSELTSDVTELIAGYDKLAGDSVESINKHGEEIISNGERTSKVGMIVIVLIIV